MKIAMGLIQTRSGKKLLTEWSRIVMVVIVFGVTARLEAGEGLSQSARLPEEVAWSVEFEDTADVKQARLGLGGSLGPDQTTMKAENGVLHLGAAFGPQTRYGDGVHLTWGRPMWGKPATPSQPAPVALPSFDLTQYPVLEVRWRVMSGHDEDVGYNLYYRVLSRDGNSFQFHVEGLYGRPPDGAWRVTTARLAPDSSFPGPATSTSIATLFLSVRAEKHGYAKPAGMEIDYIRVRRLNAEETEAERVRVDRLDGYQPPEVPEPWRHTFFYGAFSAHERLEYMGGWEGVFDQLARSHFNSVFWCPRADLPRIAGAAEPLGIYLFPTAGNAGLIGKLMRSNDPHRIEEEVRAIVATAQDLPNVPAWGIGAVAPADLWGIAGTKQIFERQEPDRFVLFLHHTLGFVSYLDRFATVAWTYTYPVTVEDRDPWAVGSWCRHVSTVSDRPQWFTPQAFGMGPAPGPWAMPTVEEFRLMMNLAMANGVKSFGIYDYAHPWISTMVDWVGNPTPVMTEAIRLGEKWMSVVPAMLHARPILEPMTTVSSPPGPEHGLSVGAMGNAVDGPIFLVVVNEDLTASQEGEVRLPDAFIDDSREMYDLDALDAIPMTDGKRFGVVMLDPGDSRVYLLGSKDQFTEVRREILTNRVKEQLRLQAADRVIAQRWSLNLDDYLAAVRRVEDLLDARQFDRATQASETAARVLEKTIGSAESLLECREGLLAARKDLGIALRNIFHGPNVRTGQEARAEPCKSLCEQYGRARGRYIMGQSEGLVDQVGKLRESGKSLLVEMGEKTLKP
jgi:hypothetical protein